jgi:hypothetical protein
MSRILKNSYIARLGRIIAAQAGILKPRPDYPRSSRNKPCKPAGPAFSKPAGPSSLPSGWAEVARSRWAAIPPRPSTPAGPVRSPARLGLSAPFPGWANVPVGPAVPAGLLLLAPGWAGRHLSLGWADAIFPGRGRRCLTGWAGLPFPAGPSYLPRLGCSTPSPPGRLHLILARPDYSILAGPPLFTVPAGPGWDFLAQAGLLLSGAEIYLLQHILLIRHRLQRLVPVLGRLQARTGTSSIVICWSWDAHWLRPAYSSSPSQSYPQEEDKTDDMVILKTDARRRRPSTPRTDIDGTSP